MKNLSIFEHNVPVTFANSAKQKGVVIIVEVVSGWGDVEHAKEALINIKTVNRDITDVEVIAIIRNRKLVEQEDEIEKIIDKFEQSGSVSFSYFFKYEERQMFNWLGNLQDDLSIGLVVFVPGGHHYIKEISGRNGTVISSIDNLRSFLQELSQTFNNQQPTFILQTEFGRAEQIHAVLPDKCYLTWTDKFFLEGIQEIPVAEREGFKHYHYYAIYEDNSAPTTMSIYLFAPYFKQRQNPINNALTFEANLPILSESKLGFLKKSRDAYSNQTTAPSSLNILFYATGRDEDLNLSVADIEESLFSRKARFYYKKFKIKYVNFWIIGRGHDSYEVYHPGLDVPICYKLRNHLPQDEFLSRMLSVDVLVATGDSSILEALLMDHPNIVLYSALPHKEPVAREVNFWVSKVDYTKAAADSLRHGVVTDPEALFTIFAFAIVRKHFLDGRFPFNITKEKYDAIADSCDQHGDIMGHFKQSMLHAVVPRGTNRIKRSEQLEYVSTDTNELPLIYKQDSSEIFRILLDFSSYTSKKHKFVEVVEYSLMSLAAGVCFFQYNIKQVYVDIVGLEGKKKEVYNQEFQEKIKISYHYLPQITQATLRRLSITTDLLISSKPSMAMMDALYDCGTVFMDTKLKNNTWMSGISRLKNLFSQIMEKGGFGSSAFFKLVGFAVEYRCYLSGDCEESLRQNKALAYCEAYKKYIDGGPVNDVDEANKENIRNISSISLKPGG